MSAPEESVEKRAFEIGWEFVQEYYTVMHNKPEQLYKFYGNNSYFCNGLEGESTQYCHGKDEIRKRVGDIDYKDCRVVVSNVDSQPSDNGGIIVQVLGEMLNRDEQAIKFAQTFFLAVQQSGYYVLNDIFRNLKDEVNEECEELIQQTEEEKEEEEEEVKEEPKTEEPAKSEKAEVKETKQEKVEETKSSPTKEKKSNEAAVPAKETAPSAKEPTAEAPKSTAAKVSTATEKPAATSTTTTASTTTASTPARPMTYSSIASSNSGTTTKSWSKIAQGDGTKSAVVVKSTVSTTQKHQDNRNNSNNNNQDKDSHTVFIKLPFNISKDEISSALSGFGDIKNVEINGQKNYAFVEFSTVEQARKAVQKGEFVCRNTKINIEERKRTNKNHGNGRMNSSYNNRGGRMDYSRNYSGGSRGSNDSNNMGNRRGGSNNGKRPYKN